MAYYLTQKNDEKNALSSSSSEEWDANLSTLCVIYIKLEFDHCRYWHYWVKQSLDNIVNQYVRSWLEVSIAGTLDIIQLSKRKFGIC